MFGDARVDRRADDGLAGGQSEEANAVADAQGKAGGVELAGVGEDDGELVTSVPCEEVAAAQERSHERVSDRLQCHVADGVTVTIVDGLERVEVEQDQAAGLCRQRAEIGRTPQLTVEGPPVRDLRESVGLSFVSNVLEFAPKCRDVLTELPCELELRRGARLDDCGELFNCP